MKNKRRRQPFEPKTGRAVFTYYAKEMEGFSQAMRPVTGSYSVCPFCFHASFVALEALQKALADRRNLA